MREILFHGKRTDNGEWVEGGIVQGVVHELWRNSDRAYITVFPEFLSRVKLEEVDPTTVGQYTGLTDKNGKKIFEGDIVVCRKEICGNWIDACVEIGYVEMKHGAFGLHRKRGYYRPFKDWLEDYEYEVFGNIHDNPELLEVNHE